MIHIDFPELLMLFLLAAAGAWAFYNWTHPKVESPKKTGRRTG
jgi:hypothetical protein